MGNRITVTYQGDYVQVLSDGEKKLDFSRRLWTEVSEKCRENNCFRVLGIANTTQPLEVLDAYDHGELFRELKISAKYRIAWVERNTDAIDAVRLVETVLFNRGVNARVFPDVEEAKIWLLGDAGVSGGD